MAEYGSSLPVRTAPSVGGTLRTMVVDDEAVIRGPVGLCLETLGHEVVEAANTDEALAAAGRGPVDVALVDVRLGTANGLDLMTRLLAMQPRMKVIVITAYGSVDVAVRAMARGATDFLCKPFTPDQVAAAIARAAALRGLEAEVGVQLDRHGTAGPEADFASTSAAVQEAVITVRRMAPTMAPILIGGEMGTGKAVLARAVHGWSERPEGPFVSIDCSRRSPAYVDLALFGDAVAGEQVIAAEQAPLTSMANHGTLLIGHVEAMSPRSQARLVRLLESGHYELHGRAAPVACDCRVIATMGKDAALPKGLVKLLGKVHVTLPALRERAEDIPLLAQRYLSMAREQEGKQVLGFSVEAMDHMKGYAWPGNLRELRGAVRAAIVTAEGGYVEVGDLPREVKDGAVRTRPRAGEKVSLRDLEIAHIREVLQSAGSLQEAADILGLDLQALYRRRRQHGLE